MHGNFTFYSRFVCINSVRTSFNGTQYDLACNDSGLEYVCLLIVICAVLRCFSEAAQIFGGLAYTRGGQGEKVERLYREVRAYAIPAGSEEIMLDLGIRQAIKQVNTAKL